MRYNVISDELLSSVKYVDGSLYWATPRRGSRLGGLIGTVDQDGYISFVFNYRRFRAHRVIWHIFNGPIGDMEIDHINGNRSDNRIENIRLATRERNEGNKGIRANNTSGFAGVSRRKSDGKWTAKIRDGERRITIGAFSEKEDAAMAYARELHRIHGEFANKDVLMAASMAMISKALP